MPPSKTDFSARPEFKFIIKHCSLVLIRYGGMALLYINKSVLPPSDFLTHSDIAFNPAMISYIFLPLFASYVCFVAAAWIPVIYPTIPIPIPIPDWPAQFPDRFTMIYISVICGDTDKACDAIKCHKGKHGVSITKSLLTLVRLELWIDCQWK